MHFTLVYKKKNTEEALPLVIFTYLRAVYIKQLIPTCNSKIRHFQVSKKSQASGMNAVKPCLMPLFPTISCTSAVCTYYSVMGKEYHGSVCAKILKIARHEKHLDRRNAQ